MLLTRFLLNDFWLVSVTLSTINNTHLLYVNNLYSHYTHKQKQDKARKVGIVPKSTRKIVETGKFDTSTTDMTGHFPSFAHTL